MLQLNLTFPAFAIQFRLKSASCEIMKPIGKEIKEGGEVGCSVRDYCQWHARSLDLTLTCFGVFTKPFTKN